MRSRFRIFVTMLFVVVTSILPAQAQQAIGEIVRQKGTAHRSVVGAYSDLQQGSEIFIGDEIRTGRDARLLIHFDDDSKLTLGENARITIDQFVYAPSGESNQALAIVVGAFRFASGKIGKASPSDVALSTPVATIGIRGTVFVGGEISVGSPVGQSRYGFQIKEGAIEVIAPEGTVVLNEVGEGTFLPLNVAAAPTPVRQWTAAATAEIEAALAF